MLSPASRPTRTFFPVLLLSSLACLAGCGGGGGGSGSGSTYTVTLAQPVSAADVLTLGSAAIATLTGTLPVLPGDVSDDGVVNASDTVLDRNAFGTTNAASVFDDINGDSVVDINDYNLIRTRVGTILP